MDLDNPSYFSVPIEQNECFGGVKTRIKPTTNNNRETSSIGSSSSSLTRQTTPPRVRTNQSELRSFLRSVSTNSNDSNHSEWLIMGEPRFSDIAPDLAFKHSATSRANSLKKESSSSNTEVIYMPMPTSDEAGDELSGDEVFLKESSARYYNFSAMHKKNPRRHSIGGPLVSSRDRTSSVASSSKSFREDLSRMVRTDTNDTDLMAITSNIDEHSLRHMSYPRKRCIKCSKGTVLRPQANMDDILIVSLKCSEPAALWVDYFSSYFQQISKQAHRKSFKIQYISVEDIFNSKIQEREFKEKATSVKLQLVVVCPSFLEFISEHPEQTLHLGKLLLPDRTLALLLGVNDNDFNEVHKSALPTYFNWQRHSVGQDQDENFTKEFLSQAMAILSKIWKQQSSVVSQEKSCFSITPKKIRQGQNSVFILLTYPIQKEDILKISIEKNSELFEVKSVKRRNPYIIKITVPENLTEVTSIVNILVEKNGSIIGSRPIKCESKLRELEQILRSVNNPVDFMCQTLGFSPANKDHLDNWLVHGFQKNLPPHFNLLANHPMTFTHTSQLHKYSHEEFPTLLHFAAKFGLEKLALQLLDCPGADMAYEIRNFHEMTPLELAEINGHMQLASMLRGYMNMNEVTTMYAKLKEMSINEKTSAEGGPVQMMISVLISKFLLDLALFAKIDEKYAEGYLTPKNLQDFYKLCPAPRPVGPDTYPTNNILTGECTTPSGYMAMNTPLNVSITKLETQIYSEPHYGKPKRTYNYNSLEQNGIKAETIQKNLEIIEDKVQKELAEIINDFKNNVHSIAQVERLVDEWKNRNDVQKSFKEKQDQLIEMRMRYEKIQQEMKNTMKKSTPFERIKKLFTRSKSHDKSINNDVSTPTNTSFVGTSESTSSTIHNGARPISSLSTSSNGSSGRMSTLSACSLGDSGTHSDNEERKMTLGNSHSEDDFRNELNKAIFALNYTPVPAPKPVKICQNNQQFETIEEKPAVRSATPPINDDFYIQFPPSGLPVPGLVENLERKGTSLNNEYMNISADGPRDTQHDYMNFKVPTSK